jgi:dipeptidyl aminopeptidase/acylaminoacyl peptidase
MQKLCLLVILLIMSTVTRAQTPKNNTVEELSAQIQALQEDVDRMYHDNNRIRKALDDILWYDKISDIATMDKVYLTGPPPRNIPNPTAQGAGNPLRFQTYMFFPKDMDTNGKYPLLVLPHGGVHSNFNTFYTHIVRELVSQGYVVVAPEYRGSTGYGRGFYKQIDYGGLEVEDVFTARNYMLENYDFLDKNRVGILGWSHGGLITLHNIFEHPDSYKVAYAGVPVSDLIARMGYKTQGYRELYSADFHIGKTAYEDVNEYRRRSPAWNAQKLETPLLVHTNTNDGDVNVLEVEHLINALKAYDKDFEYKIYEDIEGGHSFDRLDTKIAKEIRVKVYKFMNGYLNPDSPINSVKGIKQASYPPYSK